MFTQYGDAIAGGQRMMGGAPLGMHSFGGLGIAALIGFVVIAAIVVAIIIWAIARRSPSGSASVVPTSQPALSEDAALAIARERLARGEIDPDQYIAIVAALNGQATTAPQG